MDRSSPRSGGSTLQRPPFQAGNFALAYAPTQRMPAVADHAVEPTPSPKAAGGGQPQSAAVPVRPKPISTRAARRCELQAELRSTRKHQHRVVLAVVAVLVAVLGLTVAMLNQARSVPSPKPTPISRSVAVPSLGEPLMPPGAVVGGAQ